MQKADYSKISDYYDKGRWLSEQNIDKWLGLIKKYTKAPASAKLLDLGCGTGRFAIPIAEKLGYRVTGADASPEMLDKARAKDTPKKIIWDVQDAHHMNYPDGSFDIVFMSHVLHHCTNAGQALKECNRVLRPGGILLVRHCVIEEIREDPESVFFPEDLAINESRIATLKETKKLLKKAGFINIASEMIIQRSSNNGHELYARMATRNVSALAMIPQAAFESGLKRLYEYVQKHPDDPWLLDEKLRITAGYKRGAGGKVHFKL
jgi:ubiquinone/menaquinone biosynthesis C-methylase UbiE